MHHGPALVRPVVASVVMAILLFAVWSLAPEAIRIPLFLLAVGAEGIGYAALYVVQRGRHW